MRVKVKICGITTADALRTAAQEGVDAVGFVFAESPRQVTVQQAIQLATQLPPFVTRVAVTRNPTHSQLTEILSEFKPDVLQSELNPASIHASVEAGIPLLPVVHDDTTLEQQLSDLAAAQITFRAVLLEGPGRGGRGVAPDWRRAAGLARRFHLVLAGGLRPDNVASAIQDVRPYAVDVSSGVETIHGIKDPVLITEFMTSLRDTQRAQHDSGVI